MRFGFSSALLVAGSYAAIDACGPSDFNVAFQSFMQGFQSDPTSTSTDCYASVESFTS